MSPFTENELNTARAKIKSSKAPGPDGLPSEVYTWLDQFNRRALLQVFNHIYSTGRTLTEWSLAAVVEIYKGKGSHTDPEMYRPISLLSTAYKLFARLLPTHDSRLQSTTS